jgi:hypothetical protein
MHLKGTCVGGELTGTASNVIMIPMVWQPSCDHEVTNESMKG